MSDMIHPDGLTLERIRIQIFAAFSNAVEPTTEMLIPYDDDQQKLIDDFSYRDWQAVDLLRDEIMMSMDLILFHADWFIYYLPSMMLATLHPDYPIYATSLFLEQLIPEEQNAGESEEMFSLSQELFYARINLLTPLQHSVVADYVRYVLSSDIGQSLRLRERKIRQLSEFWSAPPQTVTITKKILPDHARPETPSRTEEASRGNPEHVKIVRRGRTALEEWQKKHPTERLDLSGADLSRVNLSGENLSGADMRGTNLSETHLEYANLSGADLSGGTSLWRAYLMKAKLTGANLTEAGLNFADLTEAVADGVNLSGAILHHTLLERTDLTNAILKGAKLERTQFWGTILDGADLSGAASYQVVYAKVNLAKVKGLDIVFYSSPSTVGLDTLLFSGGNVPPEFLRGCDIPQSVIDLLPSLIGEKH